MPTYLTTTDRPIRQAPAGCDQQGRVETRTHRVVRWPDTISTDWSDVGASRGCVEDCTDHGALDDGGTRMPAPSSGWILALAVLCIAALAACWLIAGQLSPPR